jgi:hypothetical protein
MTVVLLIVHTLIGTALLGAITHQVVSALRHRRSGADSFLSRYAAVNQRTFTLAVVSLYVVQVGVGALIYPAYRLNVRIPFEEMSLGWAIGLFELKEHFAGIGLVTLPFYAYCWRAGEPQAHPRDRIALSLLIAFIVWWDFLVGHLLNNMRGLT